MQAFSKKRFFTAFKGAVAAVLIFSAVFYTKSLSQGVLDGIQICLNSLIPSLFFFMALSAVLMRTGIGEKLFFFLNKPLSRLFRIPPSAVPIFCFSLLGGFPVGARLLADAVVQQELDQDTADRMLAYCVNCGPAFLISAVSIPIFHNFSVGLVVYLSQILAAFCIGWLSARKQPFSEPHSFNRKGDRPGFAEVLVQAVRSTISAMAIICAFVLIFNGIAQVLRDSGLQARLASLLEHVMTAEKASILIPGLLEVTNGCMGLRECQSLLLLAFLTGFGGLCVHIQIQAMVSRAGVRMKRFYLWRPVYIALSLFFSMVLIRFFGGTAAVFSPHDTPVPHLFTVSPIGSILLVLLSIMLLLSCRRSDIMKKERRDEA